MSSCTFASIRTLASPSGLCAVARLVAEARRWLAFAVGYGLPHSYAAEKVLGALALSARLATPSRSDAREVCDRPAELVVPTKLVGVSAFQPALRALRATRAPAGLPLRLAVERGRVAVFAGGRLLGLVQPKHAWLVPLVEHGASAVLLQVTGDAAKGHTHGLNLALTGLDAAIRAFEASRSDRATRASGAGARPAARTKPAA